MNASPGPLASTIPCSADDFRNQGISFFASGIQTLESGWQFWMNENTDLYSESIGVRHEAQDGENNEAGKQGSDLSVKTKVFVGDVMKEKQESVGKRGQCDGDGRVRECITLNENYDKSE